MVSLNPFKSHSSHSSHSSSRSNGYPAPQGPPHRGQHGPPQGGPNGGYDDEDDDYVDADNYDRSRDTSNQDDEQAEKDLDKDLEWTARKPQFRQAPPPLNPVVIVPQKALGIAELFLRAWAPSLESHDVRLDEWLQFIDHLNVCKTASPPLQVLGLAGKITGYLPLHFAGLASLATGVVTTGGIIAVARIRITRYLKRANADYFVPRGLVATLVKQDGLHELTGQPPNAPMLLDNDMSHMDAQDRPDIIAQRMQAFRGTVARLVVDGIPPPAQEQSTLDRWTASMNQRSANKSNRKSDKEQAKYLEKKQEAEEEAQKIRAEAQEKMAKKPKDRAKIEQKMNKELAKLKEDIDSEEEDYMEKAGKGGKKTEKALKSLMFVAVMDARLYQKLQAAKGQGQGQGQ